MTDKHEFQFEIDAPREDVWRALVDPEALVGWFASEARVTLEVGGEYFIAHGEHGEASTIQEIVPGERLRAGSGEMAVEYILEGREGKTLLRIVHSGFGDDALESLERGWGFYMKTLSYFLAHHADDAASAAYLYSGSSGTIEEVRQALPETMPAGAAVVDELPRSIGATVPELGDGIFRASIEGGDGEALVWIHLIAYGDGRERLAAVKEEVERKLGVALQQG